jgi:hypothetical protein
VTTKTAPLPGRPPKPDLERGAGQARGLLFKDLTLVNWCGHREVVAQLDADHRRDLKKLSGLAFVFLDATDGDEWEAEKLLDDAVDLLFEGGALSLWRYRVVLAAIREGL